jgi:hypothetical protein
VQEPALGTDMDRQRAPRPRMGARQDSPVTLCHDYKLLDGYVERQRWGAVRPLSQAAGRGVAARRTLAGVRVASRPAPRTVRRLAWGLLGVTGVTLALGTVVTGSGPHSGDPAAGRTGLDPATVSQLHADSVMLLVGMTVATWVALRATGADPRLTRAVGVLLAVELAQGVVGYVQYFTGLPVLLVGVHLAGACLVLVAAVRVVLATRDRGPLGAREGEPVTVPAQALRPSPV